MTVINGKQLLVAAPLNPMFDAKVVGKPTTHGLSEAGYDIRIKQDVQFFRNPQGSRRVRIWDGQNWTNLTGRFALASAIEEFHMPENLMGIVHDKSTWARKSLSVFNTVIEPGFVGGLTLELVYHGEDVLEIPAGCGIAQVIFHEVSMPTRYNGRYQFQGDYPVAAKEIT